VTERAARADKQAVRERVWAALTDAKVVGFPGAKGRIPNFTGAGHAAARLAALDAWRDAAALKANPDMPQLPVRAQALADGKRVYMAVPKLTDVQPFRLLDPERITEPPRKAASIPGSARLGLPVGLEDLEHIDLIVCGTVAVNRAGVRIGKGGGFSDLEFALGVEFGVVDDATIIVTTVHALQVLDEQLPETEHDFRVDLIVTPDEVIECDRARRPPGVLWDHLDDVKIGEIPALAARVGSTRRRAGRA
jgi:5-formyltetrahydrofolate cyclo-ligase